jgi:beta-glucosidase
VAQIYLAPPANPPVPMSPRVLAGFERVDLPAGAARRITVHLNERAFCYWSTDRHTWQVAAGERIVSIAASSRDIRLQGRVPERP